MVTRPYELPQRNPWEGVLVLAAVLGLLVLASSCVMEDVKETFFDDPGCTCEVRP